MESPIRSYRKTQDITLREFAELFGVNTTTALYWERVRVPPERVIEIEKATGIPRHDLRPDLYEDA
jgi:DNA-binding transcriptional regulator YdaS (Cro superfamily)